MEFQKNNRFRFKNRNRKNNVNMNLFYKYVAAISASMTVAGYGMIISWTSPSLPHLTSPASTFSVTEMQGAWIASILSCGIIVGYLLNPFLIDIIGSKRTLLFLAIPQILSCILIYFGKNWILLCSARIIGGIGYGGGLCSTAVYVSQIGDESNRGFFLTFVKMFFNIGVFVTMIFGAFLPYDVMNLAILSIPVIFVVSFFFMPDTDQFREKGEYVQEKLTGNYEDNEEVFKANEDDMESGVFVEDTNFTGSSCFGDSRICLGHSSGYSGNPNGIPESANDNSENPKVHLRNLSGIGKNSDSIIEHSNNPSEIPAVHSSNKKVLSENAIGLNENNKNTNTLNKNKNTIDLDASLSSSGENRIIFSNTTNKAKILQRSSWWKLFFLKNNRMALLIILCASLTEILSGHMAIVSFAQQIFQYSSTFLKAEYAALILAGLKIGASFFSSFVVEKFERRYIFLITGILASLSQGAVGLFFFLKFYLKIDVSSITWLPLVGVSAYEVVGSIGMSSLYYVYQGELFSDDIKGQGVTCTNIAYEIITFLVKLHFQMVIDAVGIYSVFWGFSVCCAIGSCVTFWLTPEIKGKNKREIQKLLGSRGKKVN